MPKTKLSIEQVKKIANLAKLALSSKEVKKFQKQLSETLEYVERLNKLNTKKVKPTFQVTGLENVAREDKTEPSFSQTEALASTKSQHNGYFQVRSIF